MYVSASLWTHGRSLSRGSEKIVGLEVRREPGEESYLHKKRIITIVNIYPVPSISQHSADSSYVISDLTRTELRIKPR